MAARRRTDTPENNSVTATDPPSSETHHSAARPAAHGVVLLSAAQAILLVCGYAVHIVTARNLSVESYGRFVVVISVIGVARAFQMTLLPSGFRKIVSEDHRRLHVALSVGAKWYALTVAVLFVAFLALTPLLARLLGDPALLVPMIVVAFELPFHGAFVLSRSLLGAVRHYASIALVLIVYALSRILAVAVLVYLRPVVASAVLGQVVAVLIAGAFALVLCLRARKGVPSVPYPPLMRRAWHWTAFEFPGQLGMHILTNLDLWMLTAYVTSRPLVGLYGAAYALSRLPRFFIAAVGNAVFPRVSGAHAAGDDDLARSVAARAVRLIIIVFVLACALVAGSASAVVTLLFKSAYARAGLCLAILMAAMSFFGLMSLLCSLIAAANRPGVRLALILSLVPLALVLNLLLIPRLELTGAALASLITLALGALSASIMAQRCLGTLRIKGTLLRCLAAGAAVGVLGGLWPAAGLMLLAEFALCGLLYLLILLLAREFRHDDLKLFQSLLTPSARRNTD